MPDVTCPACGAARPDLASPCVACGAAGDGAVASPPSAAGASDLPSAGGETGHEELVYELTGWDGEQRTTLDGALTAAGVVHQWEGGDLLVPETEEERVDGIVEAVEGAVALEPASDDGTDDEAVYDVMAHLHDATDRLIDDGALDVGVAAAFVTAAGTALDTPTPYGLADAEWDEVRRLATDVTAALDVEASDEAVLTAAVTLRAHLARFV